MIKTKISSRFSNLSKTNRFIINLSLVVFLAWFDNITPPAFNMRLFYLIPIFLSVWYEKEMKTGIFFSILSTLLYYYIDLSHGIYNLFGFYLIWELLITFSFYITFVVIVHKFKNAHMLLRQSESQFRNLFNNSEVGMFRTKLDGSEILEFNEKYLRILNYTREEVVGKPSVNIWADKSRRDKMLSILKADGHVKDFEFDLLNKQGEVRKCITSLHLNRDTGILEGSIMDLTDIKLVDAKLRELASIVQFSEDAIIGLNLDGIITSWNKGAEKIYAYKESEMLGKSISLFTPPENKNEIPEMLSRIRSGEHILHYETVRRRKDGKEIKMSISFSPIYDVDGRIVAASTIGHDITHRKKAELLIQQQNDKLQELNATKDKFFSIIAHDLKSPFHGFLGLTQEIIKSASDISVKELTELGNAMYHSADNLFRLLQNLLEWALMQSGSASVEQKDIILTDIISQNVEAIKVRSQLKGISINNIVTDHLHAYVDEKMINSILLNLLSNSVKFTPINGEITISAKKIEDQMIEVSVKDTGIGMPKILVEKLFILGEKTGRKGTDGELSTGLGLLLCKEFIEKNGGRIWVDSEEGVGSTFYFTVPGISPDL
jgi:PAS domain S-box-containing protein